MGAREMMTARTEERPVLKLAQWRLINENPWLDWTKCTSDDSWLMSLEMDRSALSWKTTGGAAVVEVLFHSSNRSCSSCALMVSSPCIAAD